LGIPIYSYNLSLLGFWTLAFFYSQVGGHHLIGGPVPTWLITLSIVQSMMMIVPVFAVAVNQHMTVFGHFRALRYSPTLRFIVFHVVDQRGRLARIVDISQPEAAVAAARRLYGAS
jgi:cytochrome c oxidase cbb3-type subunit 1